MGRNHLKLAMAAMALAGLPAAANAAVTYSFVADSSYPNPNQGGLSFIGSFVFTVDDYITASQTIASADLTSCTVTASDGSATACGDQFLAVDPIGDVVQLTYNGDVVGSGSVNYFFDPGTFAQNGTYETVFFGADQHATLSITGSAGPGDPSVAPEPSTWALMIGGFGLAGSALRRRARVAA
ncbi:MAG: PEPxxWA-CTERM sorting domain-containing protein [Alphaproteobacteria bacterium]|nr:PEPxxWA-CTERM sorting domain-containing protein [Alphaproteobacteria bacterium]MBU1516086.1 PEPxxWA-CTERM sorting domain-containing protein [Alphaproteobacteria bacterium]MBU2092699.1 PEPxxWA-CTERM sorting domain-containing protein [Alphaproteobacteria bacterium]MBU2153776.1 PEPxxWA-CTERM sorting domain-containing protein [Alphaproteobacteria bacterium]MBU2308404.1 PEPxxWA-CTERM sorting domain-containing protein [Alphaproteobacteria bacterium]